MGEVECIHEMPISWCAECRPVPEPPRTRTAAAAPPTPRSIAAKVHAAGPPKPRSANLWERLGDETVRTLVTLVEYQRSEGTLPEGHPIRGMRTQREVAEHYGVNPASVSQWVASYRWLVAAGLSEEERRSRMAMARELYHLKNRSGSSAGVRSEVARSCESIAMLAPTARAAAWDSMNDSVRRRAKFDTIAASTAAIPKPHQGASPSASASEWRDYDSWNSAFAEVVYTRQHAQQPVYLDVEDELLEAVAAHQGLKLSATEACDTLVKTVRDTLVLEESDGPGSVFSRHRVRVDDWGDRVSRDGVSVEDPPPVLALLAVFARSAENMERDEHFRANAYYPRLAELLAIEGPEINRMEHSFRRHGHHFWRAVDDWLSGLGGLIGLPTAEPVGHRHIGMPLSQALIRAADRRRFIEFFTEAELEPGIQLTPDDITRHLDRWVRAGHASASIARLWRTPSGKTVVAESALLALAQWDGAVRADADSRRVLQPPVVTARITKRLKGRRLDLGFALRGHLGGDEGVPDHWLVTSVDPAPMVRVVPVDDRLLTAHIEDPIDAPALLTGKLTLRPMTYDDTLSVSPRLPQPLVVLAHLPEAGLFVEVDRVRLLETHILLVNSAAQKFSGPNSGVLKELLDEIALDTYTKDESVKGVPDGWVLYRDVTVVRSHDRTDPELDVLRPTQASALRVSDGLRLPGHAVQWHADAPLAVTGSVVNASHLQLCLFAVDRDEPVRTWQGDVEEISATTDGLTLTPGAYRVELTASVGSRTQTSTLSFTLCDSTEPRTRPSGAPLAYDLAHPGGVLTATPASNDERPAQPKQAGLPAGPSADITPGNVWWNVSIRQVSPLTLTSPPPPSSCAVKGNHYWLLENTSRSGLTRQTCKSCGRVGYTDSRASKRRAEADSGAPTPLRSRVFGGPLSPISGTTLLDALTWMGGGSSTELARLVRQVDDSALTVDEIARSLETVGHINVERETGTFTISRWEMASRQLIGLADGTWMPVGSWTRADVRFLQGLVLDDDGNMTIALDGWIPRRIVSSIDAATAEAIAELLDAQLVPNAGRSLLAALPPLCEAVDLLPTSSAEGIFEAEWYDAGQASWFKVESIAASGAYRLRNGYVPVYYLRTASDVTAGKVRRADARTVKHAAARSRPILGYDADAHRLLVPLGADLPGLYGRAIAQLSGHPPRRVDGRPLLAYEDVDELTARNLYALLKGQP